MSLCVMTCLKQHCSIFNASRRWQKKTTQKQKNNLGRKTKAVAVMCKAPAEMKAVMGSRLLG